MPQLEIPRQKTTQNLLETENQLHVFVDASIVATGAVVYLRSLNKTSNEVQTAFVIGNCKAAPVKQLSVPKLELEASVTDLNTDTFLNAYRRFTSRRCQPADLYSDNGKTFVGAKEELKRCLNDLDKDKIHKALAAQNTKWHFNPPHGPHFGGAWERLTQSVNWTPLIILGSRKFTFDNFHTIIVEAKAMMNSRPLTNVSDAMENEQPLMPNHFLLQRPYNSLPPVIFPSTKPANMKSWKNVQQFLNHIWRRVVREYLPTLIKQPKSTENDGNSLKVNDVVWILQVMCTH
ncbi:uncharacterized protein LOC142343057 [Convolutriloba macropyga]|uniref:uncharacterized protein LOC142343057 n=1 Tax=Convolutriloba macropyga TaxID=536237 RepID=UPI003F51EBE2